MAPESHAVVAWESDHDDMEAIDDENDFEARRLANIEENKKMLESLGLGGNILGLPSSKQVERVANRDSAVSFSLLRGSYRDFTSTQDWNVYVQYIEYQEKKASPHIKEDANRAKS